MVRTVSFDSLDHDHTEFVAEPVTPAAISGSDDTASDSTGTSRMALKPLLVALSLVLVCVVFLTYSWHRVTRSQISGYEEATSFLILDTIVETIEDYTMIHVHAVSVAAKALTHYSALRNSSTNTVLLDRLMVTHPLSPGVLNNSTVPCVISGWHAEYIFCCRHCADGV